MSESLAIWNKIVDFLIVASFLASLIFFGTVSIYILVSLVDCTGLYLLVKFWIKILSYLYPPFDNWVQKKDLKPQGIALNPNWLKWSSQSTSKPQSDKNPKSKETSNTNLNLVSCELYTWNWNLSLDQTKYVHHI